MKKYYFLIILGLTLGLVLAGCSLLSNISQVPATGQKGMPLSSTANLVALWHFDEGEGDTAYDSSGTILPNDGTVYGADWVDGKFGKALSFNGVNDYVEIDSEFSIMPATLTVEAWVQPGKTGVRQSIVSKWDGMGDASYSLELTAGNKFLFYLHDGVTTQSITGTTIVEVGTWYHVAGIYDGSKANLYVDTSLEAGPTTLVAPMTTSSVPLRIGASAQKPPTYSIYCVFKGLVDEVRIWKVALSQDQLGKVYDFNGFFPPVDKDGLNTVKAGRAIPVKFSLNGHQGLDIFAANYPRSIPIDCDEANPDGEIEDTVTAIESSLDYDASDEQYIFVWKTDKIWAGTCRRLEVKLKDGTSHFADFYFK